MQTLLSSPTSPSGLFPSTFHHHLPLRPIPARHVPTLTPIRATPSSYPPPPLSPNDPEAAQLLQISKKLESTARYFKRLGGLGFWGQLVCTVVAAVILSFSVVITGKISSPPTFYATAGGIVTAFISVFWSFGYSFVE